MSTYPEQTVVSTNQCLVGERDGGLATDVQCLTNHCHELRSEVFTTAMYSDTRGKRLKQRYVARGQCFVTPQSGEKSCRIICDVWREVL